jgi:glutamate dehydrogenase
MHIEIDRVDDLERAARLEQGLTEVLRDVRTAVQDWEAMQAQARAIVDQLRAEPPPLDDVEVSEVAELLSWLADEHFTFLGYREYVLEAGDDRAADNDGALLKAVSGSGLGILRGDVSAKGKRLPGPVAERARAAELSIITKANSRSTVHRPAYLDYVGIKTFDEAGEVCGERRFLGLFSSAAYTESVTRIPVLRRKCVEALEQLGFQAASHSGKALFDLLETYPRDELFQTQVDQLVPTTATDRTRPSPTLACSRSQSMRRRSVAARGSVSSRAVALAASGPRPRARRAPSRLAGVSGTPTGRSRSARDRGRWRQRWRRPGGRARRRRPR